MPPVAALVVLVVVATTAAWSLRFVQDDTFILFRYAANLANGDGLVWNVGDRTEGYTTFLWTLLLSVGSALAIDLVTFVWALGLAVFVMTLLLTYLVGREMYDTAGPPLLAVLLLATNYSFLAYATGGLETQLQSCLFIALAYGLLRLSNMNTPSMFAVGLISVLAALALLTRLDSVIPVIIVGSAAALIIMKAPAEEAGRGRRVSALLIPAGVVVGTWFAWKVNYYGQILPNTFAVKAVWMPASGLRYIYRFFDSYWLAPLLLLALLAVPSMVAARRWAELLYCGIIVAWTSYVVAVGGDFMEFRLLMPVLPLAFLVVTWLIMGWIRQTEVRVALVTLCLLGSLHHALTFKNAYRRGIETIGQLQAHLTAPFENWIGIGRTFGSTFEPGSNVILAAFPAGAIGYYSRLPLIDMFGLSDAWVARHGEPGLPRPGHTRRAPFTYLIRRGVNIVIGDPWVRDLTQDERRNYSPEDLSRLGLRNVRPSDIPSHARILEIPLQPGQALVTLYLTAHPTVDRAIANSGWKVYTIDAQSLPSAALLVMAHEKSSLTQFLSKAN